MNVADNTTRPVVTTTNSDGSLFSTNNTVNEKVRVPALSSPLMNGSPGGGVILTNITFGDDEPDSILENNQQLWPVICTLESPTGELVQGREVILVIGLYTPAWLGLGSNAFLWMSDAPGQLSNMGIAADYDAVLAALRTSPRTKLILTASRPSDGALSLTLTVHSPTDDVLYTTGEVTITLSPGFFPAEYQLYVGAVPERVAKTLRTFGITPRALVNAKGA